MGGRGSDISCWRMEGGGGGGAVRGGGGGGDARLAVKGTEKRLLMKYLKMWMAINTGAVTGFHATVKY